VSGEFFMYPVFGECLQKQKLQNRFQSFDISNPVNPLIIGIILSNHSVKHPTPSEEQEERKSLGMKITKARIDILNKIKKSKAAIQLFNKEQGVRVEVRLHWN
jgi:hypothetical protein